MTAGAKRKTGSLFTFLVTLTFVVLGAWVNRDDVAAGRLPFHLILFASWLPLATVMLLRAWGKPNPTLLKPTVDFIFTSPLYEKLSILIAGIGFVVAGHGMVNGAFGDSHTLAKAIGWLSILFFGLCGVVALFMLCRPSPTLTLSRDGIVTRGLGIDLVPWYDVRGVRSGKLMRSTYVGVDLHDEAAYLARAGAGRLRRGAVLARRFNLPLFSLAPAMFGTNAEDLLAAIEIRWRHYAAQDNANAGNRDTKETT